MTVLATTLDAESIGHLMRALNTHRAWCRANGFPFPTRLNDLVTVLLSDSAGQEAATRDLAELSADTPTVPIVYTFEEAAELLKTGERTVRRLVAEGQLHTVMVGGRRRIHRDDLADYATNLRTAADHGRSAGSSSGGPTAAVTLANTHPKGYP